MTKSTKINKLLGRLVIIWSAYTGGKSFEVAARLNTEIYKNWKRAADACIANPSPDNIKHLKVVEYHAKKYISSPSIPPSGRKYLKRLMRWTMNIK